MMHSTDHGFLMNLDSQNLPTDYSRFLLKIRFTTMHTKQYERTCHFKNTSEGHGNKDQLFQDNGKH